MFRNLDQERVVVTAASALWTWFGNFGTWIWNAIKNLGTIIGNSGSTIANWPQDWYHQWVHNYDLDLGKSYIWDNIIHFAGDILTKAENWGKSIVGSIVSGIGKVAGHIWDAITGAFKNKPAGTATVNVKVVSLLVVTLQTAARSALRWRTRR